ncbi:MAG: hypothetical protein ACD_79C00253G0002 [uncultured bacterium]|nr:MAG: hypothetical protein ACD_79C00253G0002 [uncultured bacterium]
MKKLLFLLIILFICSITYSETEIEAVDENIPPLWNFGLFNSWAQIPHYRGSDEYNNYLVPIPYFVYRGKVIQTERETVKGIIYQTDNFVSEISFHGNPPVDSDNKAREGMGELEPLIEAGPAVKWYFLGRKKINMYLQAAVRGVSSVDTDKGIDFKYEGIHSSVNLIYKRSSLFGMENFRTGLSFGIENTDKNYNSFFYDVKQEYVTEERHFYESEGGYAGKTISGSIVYKINKDLSFASFFRWENIDDAVFEESPLVKEKNNHILGMALIWNIKDSKENSRAKY